MGFAGKGRVLGKVTGTTESGFQVEFLRKLQRLLDEGHFVATYKFALLHALADVCIERHVCTGAPLRVRIGELAEKIVVYYWRQVLPFSLAGSHGGVLAQNSGQQAAILRALREAQATYGPNVAAMTRNQAAWNRLIAAVARTVKAMPLWKLQTLRSVGEVDEFLYRRSTFDDSAPAIADQSIELNAGVASTFRAFHGLITGMIRGGWVRTLRGMAQNRELLDHTDDLFEFLFESSRTNLSGVAALLRDYQDDQCFYCRRKLRDQAQVDHFVPWSKYPFDLATNFVLTDARCNGSKSDHLAGEEHLEHWARSRLAVTTLDTDFLSIGVSVDHERSREVARWCYEQAEVAQTHGWVRDREFELIQDRWRYLLTA